MWEFVNPQNFWNNVPVIPYFPPYTNFINFWIRVWCCVDGPRLMLVSIESARLGPLSVNRSRVPYQTVTGPPCEHG